MASAIALRTGGPLGQRGLAPGVLGRVGGVEGQLHVLGGRPGDLAEGLAVDRADVDHVLAFDRGDPLPPDEVLVPGLHLDHASGLAGRDVLTGYGFDGSFDSLCRQGHLLPPCSGVHCWGVHWKNRRVAGHRTGVWKPFSQQW